MNKCIGLGEKFINCFHNIYMSKDNDNKKKWLIEMHHCFNEASNIVLDGKNRPLLLMELMDWFLTAGSNYQTFINGSSEDEVVTYDKFIKDLIYSNDVVTSLENIKLLNND